MFLKGEIFYWQNGVLHFNLAIVTRRNLLTLKIICYLYVLL